MAFHSMLPNFIFVPLFFGGGGFVAINSTVVLQYQEDISVSLILYISFTFLFQSAQAAIRRTAATVFLFFKVL